MHVGSEKPVARISFWMESVLLTLTLIGAGDTDVARGVAGPRRQDVGTVGECPGVPRVGVRRGCVFRAGVYSVDDKLHAGDSDVVLGIGCDDDDVADLSAVEGRRDVRVGVLRIRRGR